MTESKSTCSNDAQGSKIDNEGYLETLFKDYEMSELDKVNFDWGDPIGHEIL